MSCSPKAVVLLGADRVGKSTLAKNAAYSLTQNNFTATLLHFSGPKPHHSSPIEQYIEPFDKALESHPEFIICDRGFSEVCFYEKFRRQVDLSEEWANAAESYFLKKATVSLFLIEREWEMCKKDHIEEIISLNPDSSAWWIRNQLLAREAEHRAYYTYMHDYLKIRSLVPYTRLLNLPIDFALLDLIPGV